MMQPRIDLYKLSPDVCKPMLGLEQYLSQGAIEKKLLPRLKLRVSQSNGCADCLDMRWKDLQVEGENEQRMPDAVYEQARQHFSEQELADLTLAVVAINGWNRHSIAFRVGPGTCQPQKLKKSA